MPGLQSLAQHFFPTCTKLIAPELNALNGLPMELVLLGSDLLPPADLICLSMCKE
ncbi:unnamed protein product [Penicillium camemberti]|uniref:Str. FM013 n=1 Tax=Penicillium camemberti (strain FM 013) TaxID=1429867 RepID=A0A0G4NUY8_PENC3|nr:unnamed protein product [Penicillium camemberti]